MIIINIDALRPDHMGCYGYSRNVSPFIDNLASGGIVFEGAMSNSSYTRESVAVLFSGRLPSSSGSFGWYASPSGSTLNLGELFRNAGYRTGFFSNTAMLRNPNFTKGFDEVQHLSPKWDASGMGPKLTESALEFVRSIDDQRFLLYLHYMDPHGPYDPPREFYLKFAQEEFSKPLNLYDDIRPRLMALLQEGFGPGEARFEDMVVRYDSEIAHTDESIKALFQGLEELQTLDSTFVIITADHGEEFLEHRSVEHTWTLYNESLRIPLILWAPACIRPTRIAERVSVVDLLPTILELMEIPHDRKDFDGTGLFMPKGDKFFFRSPQQPFIAELLIEERNVVRTVIHGDMKYIAAQKWIEPEDRLAAVERQQKLNDGRLEKTSKDDVDIWGPIVHEELYDLEKDPHEKTNLIADGAEAGNRLRNKLRVLMQGLKSSAPIASEGMQEDFDPADLEHLRTLGYIQ